MKRRLSLIEGTSDKFWYIDAEADQVTVSYGRRGTAGTTKTKSYESAEKALADAEKQVAAKLKKGYSDENGAGDAELTPVELTPVEPTESAPQKKAATPKKGIAAPAEPKIVTPEILEPLEIDGDGDDLGLAISPFEQAYDLSTDVTIEVDTEPFDPAAESARVDRIAEQRTWEESSYWVNHRWQFSEPVFTTIPSAERATWWREFLQRADDLAKVNAKQRTAEFVSFPRYFRAALVDDPTASATELLAQWGSHVDISALTLRPLLSHQSHEALLQAGNALPAALPEVVSRTTWGAWQLNDLADYFRAAVLGIRQDEIRGALDRIPRGALAAVYQSTISVCMLAATPAERIATARRGGAKVSDHAHVVPWLVSTGAAGFGVLLSSVDEMSKGVAEEVMLAAAAVCQGPGSVPLFIDALTSKAAVVATTWLQQHPGQLLGASLSPTRAEAAAPFLRALPIEQLRAALPQTRGGVRGQVEAILAEADLPTLDPAATWWADAAAVTTAPKRGTVPTYLNPVALPPLVVKDHRLSSDQTELLLAGLSTGETTHALVTAAKQHVEPASRDRFAVALLNLWLANGGPAKNIWLMTGAGLLGGDRFVHTLTPMIREWPGLSQHKRAVTGLDALRNVGSDNALQSISGIASKVKFAALKKRANEAMGEIADARGFTRDQLEDRVVPDGGLDERGTRSFDYGPRQFLVNLTPDAKVIVRDLVDGRPTGKPKTALPSVLKSDDATLATEAREEFKVLKKTLTGLAKVQTQRFERAMMSGRRWTFAEHQQFIARHPLLRGLLSALVWGIYDADQQLLGTVRFDEEGAPVTPDDEPVEISEDQHLGIVHPIDLAPQTISQWADVLADYELVAPFQQLDRPVFSLPADQGDDTDLHGLPAGEIPAGKLFGAFTKYGWQRGDALDNGVYTLHALQFQSANLTAVIRYSGMWMGSVAEQDDQTIESAYLLEGIVDVHRLGWGDGWRGDELSRIPWSRAPKALVNEVIATIEMIAN